MTIGIKNFNMKIDVKKEEKKMKNMRKIGDKTGIGFSESSNTKGQDKKSSMAMTQEEIINQKIMREA